MGDFDRGYFCLHSQSAGDLKSYSSGSRNGANILKLEVSYGSAVEMGYALEELGKLHASVKARQMEAKSKRPRLLALPAPEVQK